MNQPYTLKVEARKAVINVGCMGQVNITVHSDGWWEIHLDSNRDGNQYYRSRGSMFPANELFCHSTMTYVELPEWMFEQFHAKIEELVIMFDRGALVTPEIKGATA